MPFRFPRRFSLRSLLLLFLAGGAGVAVAQKWEPWKRTLTLNPTGKYIREARFSPDGKYILTHGTSNDPAYDQNPFMSDRSRTTVWTLSGKEVFRTDWCLNMGASGYDGADFRCNTQWLRLIYAHHGACEQLVDLRTQKMLFPDSCAANLLSFSKDEKRCAVVLDENKSSATWLALYDLEKAELLTEERVFFTERERRISNIRLSSNGLTIAMICEDFGSDGGIGTFLFFYDVTTRRIIRATGGEPYNFSNALAFSPDASRAVLLGNDGFRILNTADGSILAERKDLKQVPYPFKLDGGMQRLFYEEETGGIFWIDLNSNDLRPQKIQGDSLANTRMAGDWLALKDGGKLKVRNLRDGSEPIVIDEVVAEPDPMGWSGDWWRLFETPGCITFHSMRSGGASFRKNPPTTFTSKKEPLPAPDGQRVLTAGERIEIFGFLDSTPRFTLPQGVGTRAEWSPDGNSIITSNAEPESTVWTRVRSDEPYGLLWLPELWLAIAFTLALLFSLRSDWRRLRIPVKE